MKNNNYFVIILLDLFYNLIWFSVFQFLCEL